MIDTLMGLIRIFHHSWAHLGVLLVKITSTLNHGALASKPLLTLHDCAAPPACAVQDSTSLLFRDGRRGLFGVFHRHGGLVMVGSG